MKLIIKLSVLLDVIAFFIFSLLVVRFLSLHLVARQGEENGVTGSEHFFGRRPASKREGEFKEETRGKFAWMQKSREAVSGARANQFSGLEVQGSASRDHCEVAGGASKGINRPVPILGRHRFIQRKSVVDQIG